MNIGLTGSHRTGKTTLAKALAKKNNLLFVETKVGDVFKRHILYPNQRLTTDQRICIQQDILDNAIDQWTKASTCHNGFVSDRTPLDFIAYTIAYMQNEMDQQSIECISYIDDCIKIYISTCFYITNRFFDTVFIVQPGIPVVHEDNKAHSNFVSMFHINTIINGLCCDDSLKCNTYVMPAALTGLFNRLGYCKRAMAPMS